MAQFKFQKGDKVKVTQRNGKVIFGEIRDFDYNVCTFKKQYDVDYVDGGRMMTMLCVPEEAIEKVTAAQPSATIIKMI